VEKGWERPSQNNRNVLCQSLQDDQRGFGEKAMPPDPAVCFWDFLWQPNDYALAEVLLSGCLVSEDWSNFVEGVRHRQMPVAQDWTGEFMEGISGPLGRGNRVGYVLPRAQSPALVGSSQISFPSEDSEGRRCWRGWLQEKSFFTDWRDGPSGGGSHGDSW
jgi:hypothetical protein